MTETVGTENNQAMFVDDSSAAAPKSLAPLNAAELASMFATLGGDTPGAAAWSTSYDGARRILATIEHLQGLVYVPGLWRCAKCKCGTIGTLLCASTGRMAVDKTPKQCPNGCGPMWRVTERQAGNDVIDRNDAANDRLAVLLGVASHAHIYAAVEELAKRLAEKEDGANIAALPGRPQR